MAHEPKPKCFLCERPAADKLLGLTQTVRLSLAALLNNWLSPNAETPTLHYHICEECLRHREEIWLAAVATDVLTIGNLGGFELGGEKKDLEVEIEKNLAVVTRAGYEHCVAKIRRVYQRTRR